MEALLSPVDDRVYTADMHTLQSALEWRYACKKFDETKKVPDADVTELLTCMALTPSSYGLQPWMFAVITDESLKAKLREHAWNQEQVTSCSHLIAICVQRTMTPEHVERYIEDIKRTRGVSDEQVRGYKEMMLNTVSGRSDAEKIEWNKRQAYIALGVLLAACADKRIDSCPMEGFDAAAFDTLLDLEQRGLTAVVLCPIGYRAPEETPSKKVRYALSDITLRY